MKQIDNRQKQVIQSRAEKTLKSHKNLKGKAEEHLERTPHDGHSEETGQKEAVEPIRTGPKIGRNDPCPCGSGKKYKKCCIDSQSKK